MRGMVITESVRMVSETCCRCGVLFAMTDGHRQEFLNDHSKSFYCPNGHSQHYTGKTDEQKAIERAERLERQLANAHDDTRAARMQRDEEKRSHAATRGHLTRMRRRIANGVCPCCSRSFQNVRRHMETQHPDVLARVVEDEAAREVTL